MQRELFFFFALTSILGDLYPIEYKYSSLSTLYGIALSDGAITKEEYDDAKEHYIKLWNYTGD